jgi:hypothetical protein
MSSLARVAGARLRIGDQWIRLYQQCLENRHATVHDSRHAIHRSSFQLVFLYAVRSSLLIIHQWALQALERLNIYYLMLEKMNSFADEAKYDITNVPGAQIAETYEEKRTDAWNVIENLNIIKRIISVCALSEICYIVWPLN